MLSPRRDRRASRQEPAGDRGGGGVRLTSEAGAAHQAGARIEGASLFGVPLRRLAFLLFSSAATVLLVPLQRPSLGGAAWAIALVLLLADRAPAFRRRMGILLGVNALLAFAPINTNLSLGHMTRLGIFFFAALAIPNLILARTDPGVLAFRLWPRRLRALDIVYTLAAIPLAKYVLEVWFFHINPELPTHWTLPPQPEHTMMWRLIAGINCVGIWDELFFVYTIYAILRSLFPQRVANAAQAVVYTSVLYKMAFTGIGPIVVYIFALTQGAMYEGSRRCLLWVLIVHLIVDFFLVLAILKHYYAGVAHPLF